MAVAVPRGGLRYLRRLSAGSIGEQRARALFEDGVTSPLARLESASPEDVAGLLASEPPQLAAGVLSMLSPAAAAAIVGALLESQKTPIVKHMSRMRQLPAGVLEDVASALAAQLPDPDATALVSVDGVAKAAELLNASSKTASTSILANLEADDPDLAAIVRQAMFTFDDLARIDNRGMRTLLREVATDWLTIALRGAPQAVVDAVFHGLSQRAADLIRDDLENLGHVRKSDVEAARREIDRHRALARGPGQALSRPGGGVMGAARRITPAPWTRPGAPRVSGRPLWIGMPRVVAPSCAQSQVRAPSNPPPSERGRPILPSVIAPAVVPLEQVSVPPLSPIIQTGRELELEREVLALREETARLAVELASARARVLEESEPEIVRLAVTVASRIVGRELAADPALVLEWIRQGFAALPGKDDVVVAVAPDIAAAIPPEALEGAAAGAKLVVDALSVRARASCARERPWFRSAPASGSPRSPTPSASTGSDDDDRFCRATKRRRVSRPSRARRDASRRSSACSSRSPASGERSGASSRSTSRAAASPSR